MDTILNSFISFFALFEKSATIILLISFLLMCCARFICRWLNEDDDITHQVALMRVLNCVIIIAIVGQTFFLNDIFINKIIKSLIIIYFTVFFSQITRYFIRRRFGKTTNTIHNKKQISDTYSSRSLSLISTIALSIIAIISCLRILGLGSLTETGGALGIIGIVLAMTQAAWAPDIINGLIILNSRFCEDGDVIQFNTESGDIIAVVFKRKLFHTECLDVANNHRIMIRNTKLRDTCLHNLSRFASAKGLRECLLFNIDYAHEEKEVKEMILRAFTAIDKQEDAREEQYTPEIRVHDTADYAVTWAVYYYIKDIKQILRIRQLVRAYILQESQQANISLATPAIIQSTINRLP